MSTGQNIFQPSSRSGPSRVHQHTFGKGREGSAFPQQRLVILMLGLLDVVLLITAVVIGIYCAKAKDYQILDAAATPLMVELSYLRNNTGIVVLQREAQAALVKERAAHLVLKRQMKLKASVTDVSQRQIETLLKEKKTLQSNKTTLEESCNRCLPGWSLLKSTCYYYSQYEPGFRKNWNDSRADCIKQGGHLVVINSLEEQALLSSSSPKLSSSGTWWQNGFWIGLTDVGGTWRWDNNTTSPDAFYWKDGQPKESGPQSGNCTAFFVFLDTMNTWYNANCQDHLLNWICEMEPLRNT